MCICGPCHRNGAFESAVDHCASDAAGRDTPAFLWAHTTANTAQAITAHGFRLIKIHPAIQSVGLVFLPLTSGFTETFYACLQFFAGLTYHASAIGRILDDVRPDVVVTDFSFLGAGLAAETRDIPYVIIYHAGLSFKDDGIPPFGSGLPIGKSWGRATRAPWEFGEHYGKLNGGNSHYDRTIRSPLYPSSCIMPDVMLLVFCQHYGDGATL